MQRWIFIKIWKAQRELQSKDCHKAYEGTMETSSRAGSQRLWLCSDSRGCWNSIFFHCSFHFSPNALMSGIMYLASREEEPQLHAVHTNCAIFSLNDSWGGAVSGGYFVAPWHPQGPGWLWSFFSAALGLSVLSWLTPLWSQHGCWGSCCQMHM